MYAPATTHFTGVNDRSPPCPATVPRAVMASVLLAGDGDAQYPLRSGRRDSHRLPAFARHARHHHSGNVSAEGGEVQPLSVARPASS